MRIIRKISDMQRQARNWRKQGQVSALVPTMGCLHEGHISLMRKAKQIADVIVVSIFVNPTQFGPNEDLDAYPRTWEADREACEKVGADVIFFPEVTTMYANDSSTWVIEEQLTQPLCGARRPNHFRGVTTVVAKLFNACLPDIAIFGQKDAQQALVIKRMVRDLNFPIEIQLEPIIREKDGLAMSSRNRYLSTDERERALAISRGIFKARDAFAAGEKSAKTLVRIVRDEIETTDGEIDYVELRDGETLGEVTTVAEPALLAVAARYGPARLIDNIVLGPDQ